MEWQSHQIPKAQNYVLFPNRVTSLILPPFQEWSQQKYIWEIFKRHGHQHSWSRPQSACHRSLQLYKPFATPHFLFLQHLNNHRTQPWRLELWRSNWSTPKDLEALIFWVFLFLFLHSHALSSLDKLYLPFLLIPGSSSDSFYFSWGFFITNLHLKRRIQFFFL